MLVISGEIFKLKSSTENCNFRYEPFGFSTYYICLDARKKSKHFCAQQCPVAPLLGAEEILALEFLTAIPFSIRLTMRAGTFSKARGGWSTSLVLFLIRLWVMGFQKSIKQKNFLVMFFFEYLWEI